MVAGGVVGNGFRDWENSVSPIARSTHPARTAGKRGRVGVLDQAAAAMVEELKFQGSISEMRDAG